MNASASIFSLRMGEAGISRTFARRQAGSGLRPKEIEGTYPIAAPGCKSITSASWVGQTCFEKRVSILRTVARRQKGTGYGSRKGDISPSLTVYETGLLPPGRIEYRTATLDMLPGTGRIEKRISVAVAVQISSFRDPSTTEWTTTENISSLGARVVTQQSKELNERVTIASLAGELQTEARVVYCQRMPDGRFGIGMQFEEVTVNWPKHALVSAAD